MFTITSAVAFITALERSLGQDNVFTPVCHSVHRGGVYGMSACIIGHMTGGACIQVSGDLHPGGSASQRQAGVCIQGVGQTLPLSTTGYGQEADGAHPT